MTLNSSVDASRDAVLPERLPARDKTVISLLIVSAFVVILNETIMAVALPRLMEDLHISASAGQWLTTAFMLTMAVVIPITGFLLQRWHTRRIYLVAMTLFSLGTAICALSSGFAILLLGRIVQASGTAIMMPLLMTTVLTLVPEHSRGKIMGNIMIVISVAPAVGPIVSGIILSTLSWRWMFIIVFPIAVAALLLGVWKLKNVTTPRDVPLDVLSVIISAFAFGGLVYGLSSLGESASGVGLAPGLIGIGVGIVALALFVLRQFKLQRDDRALLDLRTFSSSTFTISVVLMILTMIAMFGTLILLPLFTQDVLGYEPLLTGLILLPGGLLMGLLGPFVGQLYDKVGPTVLLIPGAIIVSGVFWAFSTMGTHTTFAFLLVTYLILCIGLSLTFTPLFTVSLSSLTPALYSHGSAIVGTVQQVAGAAGTALFITLMTVQVAALNGQGASVADATASGIRLSFTCGAVAATLAIGVAFFVRRKPEPVG